MSKVLIIIAQKDYQDLEFAGTSDGLLDAGYDVVIASSQTGKCTGKFGGEEQASVALRDVDVNQFDKIAFVGGPGAAAFASDQEALRIARDTVSQGKKLGAICIAPTILARAGVLNGKRATVWDSGGTQAAVLESEGATYTGEDVTVDGDIVTASGPAAADAFGKALASL